MSWSFATGTAAQGSTSSLGKAVTAGNLLVFGVFNANGTDTPGVSGGGLTWTQLPNSPINDSTNGGGISVFSAIATTTTTVTVTVTGLTSSAFTGLTFGEWSGNAASSVNDQGNGTAGIAGTNASNGMLTGSVTPGVAGDLIVSFILDLGGSPTVAEYTAGTSPNVFTKRTSMSEDPGGAGAATFAVEDFVQAGTSATNPTWTQNTTHVAVGFTAAFKVGSGVVGYAIWPYSA